MYCMYIAGVIFLFLFTKSSNMAFFHDENETIILKSLSLSLPHIHTQKRANIECFFERKFERDMRAILLSTAQKEEIFKMKFAQMLLRRQHAIITYHWDDKMPYYIRANAQRSLVTATTAASKTIQLN